MLELEKVSASYEGVPVLSEIELTVASNEVVALIGPSGTGKSTLFNCITSLHEIDSGTILLNQQVVSPKESTIGWLPQQYGLLPWKTVKENILMGLEIKKQAITSEREQEMLQLVSELGIKDYLMQYPNQLSGGQQQRVAIARTMLMTPDLCLLDEPFSALDAMTRENIQQLFLTQWQKRPVPTIIITHDVEEAVFLGHRIVVLSGSPGKISHVIDNPSSRRPISNKRVSTEFYQGIKKVREVLLS